MKSIYCISLALICSILFLGGCGTRAVEVVDSGQERLAHVTCIGVLPAAFMVDNQVVPVYAPKEKNYRRGIQVMNEMLGKELGGKNNTRFVGLDQMDSLQITGGESTLALARMVGERINCNTVLESTVKRFNERVGTTYSVESPASVAFEMRLISLEKGSILWSAKFDESQKAVMDNLLEFKKANSRRFTWITAEELLREGVKGKLADSPYLNPSNTTSKNK